MSFEGSIGEIDLLQRLVELGRERFTGAIRFEEDGIIKIVYFKDGDVLSASTNDRKDAVDEILLRAGKVSREHVKQALAKRQENETLGDALLNLGFITRKELTWARRVQVIGILRSVRAWTNGTYAIVADYLPKREEGTLFPLAQIIVEFIVTEQDRQTFERAMEGGEAVFRRSPDFDDAFARLDLNEDAAEIAAQIDGTKSALEIASVTGKDAFNVYKLLEALRRLGLIEKGEAAEVPSFMATPIAPMEDFSFESAGVADAADAFNAPAVEPAIEPMAEPEPEPEPEPMMAFEPPPPPPPPAFEPAPAKVPFALSLDDDSMTPPPLPPPAPVAPGAPEPQWGFDEAQIETAERATSPAPRAAVPPAMRRPTLSRPAPKRRSGAPLFAIIVVLLLAGAAFGAWVWWKGRAAEPAPVAVQRPVSHPVIPPPATSPATTSSAETATAAVAPATTIATTSSAPPSTPKPAPAPVTPPTMAPAAVSRLESTPAGGKVITNATAAQPSDANHGKYDEMARDYLRNASGKYTVQFELVCQTSSLQKAIAAGGAQVWFVPVSYRNQSCYRVFWGHYETREEAIAAQGHIPAALHGSTPVVVTIPKS